LKTLATELANNNYQAHF